MEAEKPVLRFVVAGHIYGNSDHYTYSIYPPFLKKLKEDQKDYNFDFLFLTGDVLYDTSATIWDYVAEQLDSLDMDWLLAPGNHDLFIEQLPKNSNELETTIGYAGPNLYLVLNTSNPGWTLDEGFIPLVAERLEAAGAIDNIFVFTHQLWWQRNSPAEFQLDSIRPNSYALYDGPSDFWKDVFPYFDSTGIETWFFAGDLGADEKLESYYEDHYNQFHFYGSGMGGGKADNYLIVEVYQNGRVDIEKVDF